MTVTGVVVSAPRNSVDTLLYIDAASQSVKCYKHIKMYKQFDTHVKRFIIYESLKALSASLPGGCPSFVNTVYHNMPVANIARQCSM